MSFSDVVVPQALNVAVSAVTPLVTRFRDTPHAELEVRFGRVDAATGAWTTGVSETSFNEIITMLSKYQLWDDTSSGWCDSHDFMYTANGAPVRTTTQLDTSLQLSHVSKQRIDMVQLQLRGLGHARVALKTETAVCARTLPETVNPHLVRIKKRRSFVRGAWRFDLTRVWRGATRSAAEQAQSSGATVFEVEVEFVPPADYWDDANHTSTYVATSLLMKMVDVMSQEMVGVDVVVK